MRVTAESTQSAHLQKAAQERAWTAQYGPSILPRLRDYCRRDVAYRTETAEETEACAQNLLGHMAFELVEGRR